MSRLECLFKLMMGFDLYGECLSCVMGGWMCGCVDVWTDKIKELRSPYL
jgi:hypothetical protein